MSDKCTCSHDKQASAFTAWFEAQFGQRPNFYELYDESLRNMIEHGHKAEAELRARERYDSMKQSALAAWTAKDSTEQEILRNIS